MHVLAVILSSTFHFIFISSEFVNIFSFGLCRLVEKYALILIYPEYISDILIKTQIQVQVSVPPL